MTQQLNTPECYIGKQFGRLSVIAVFKRSKKWWFNCKCICGTLKEIRKSSVCNGATKSCGCYYRESIETRWDNLEVKDCIHDGIEFKKHPEGLFAVSACGKILGKKGNILNPRSQGNYLIVSHWINIDGENKSRNKYVHRLVAEVWVENPDPQKFKEVNHKDCNKINNCSSNLEWVSRKLNVDHAIENGLIWNYPVQGQRGFQKK